MSLLENREIKIRYLHDLVDTTNKKHKRCILLIKYQNTSFSLAYNDPLVKFKKFSNFQVPVKKINPVIILNDNKSLLFNHIYIL
jgi:hypothetical protein